MKHVENSATLLFRSRSQCCSHAESLQLTCRVTAVDMPSEQRSLNERPSLIDDASILPDKLQTFLSECFFMGFIIIRSARKSVADTHTHFLVFFFFFFFFYRGCRGEFFFFISSFSLFLIAFCFKKNNGTFLHTCDTPKHVPRDSVLRTWQRRSKSDGAASLQAALHLHCRPYNSNRPSTYCSIFSNSHNQSILLISNIFLGITSYNIYRAFGTPFCHPPIATT